MTPDERPGLSGLTSDALAGWLAERHVPGYRARQVADGVWGGTVGSIDEMLTLPAALRTDLEGAFRFATVAETELTEADGGLTEKALHRLADGTLIESVLMHYPARPGSRERHTLCISSQAGCAVGCPFCATGELGFGRDLEGDGATGRVDAGGGGGLLGRVRRRVGSPDQACRGTGRGEP